MFPPRPAPHPPLMRQTGAMSRRVVQLMGSAAGGVERHVREVAALLAADGCAVVVAAPPGSDVVADDRVRHVVADLADRPQPSDLTVLRTVRRLARGADVVHAHGLRAGAAAVLAVRSLPRSRCACGPSLEKATCGCRSGRPGVVVTLHNLPVGGRAVRAVSAVLERIVARGADTCLGVSSDLVERARQRGARQAARALVPAPPRPAPGRSRAAVRAALEVPDDVLLVLTVARLAPQKGLPLLVDAARLSATATAAARSGRSGVRWLVAGDGPLHDEVAAQIVRTGAPVALLGRRDDIGNLMAAADVFCSTSVWEGQPLVVQEALQLGVPVVATDVGGTGEVTGEAAVLVPYGDPQALADAITGLLDSPEDRQALARAATAQAARLPTAADVLAQLTTTYDTLRQASGMRFWSPGAGRDEAQGPDAPVAGT